MAVGSVQPEIIHEFISQLPKQLYIVVSDKIEGNILSFQLFGSAQD